MKIKRLVLLSATFLLTLTGFADIKVSDVEVFSGYPWKEVVVAYTITGTDSYANFIRLTATDKATNKSYVAKTLSGAMLTEGRHVMRWNAAAENVKFSSSNVVFEVAVVSHGGVQLWANGPYWAECNVGATKPEESGYYFWWGDTVGYKRNSSNNAWVSVKDGSSFSFSSGNCPTYGKSESELQSLGYIATVNLTAAHDAARAHLGAPWRMPTDSEFAALLNNCDTEWTTRNGVYGRLVTGRGAYASKSIFLPVAGYGLNSSLDGRPSSLGYFWSSTLCPNNDINHAWGLYSGNYTDYMFGNRTINRDTSSLFNGRSVRPVREFAK